MQGGVAFHHAGLSEDEKVAVESAIVGGAVRLVVATSSLAEGVNLPVRRVVLHETHLGTQPAATHPVHSPTPCTLPRRTAVSLRSVCGTGTNTPIDAVRYRQMAGRAGRAGLEVVGEVFVLMKDPAARKSSVHERALLLSSPHPRPTPTLTLAPTPTRT